MVCLPYPATCPGVCCVPCDDYESPNDWYVRFCNVEALHMGYANRVTIMDKFSTNRTYYWDTHTMADTLNGLLAVVPRDNIFDIAGPSGYGNGVEFMVTTSALAGTVKLYSHSSYSAIEADYTYTNLTFEDYEIQLRVYDKCGIRFIRASVYGVLFATLNELNPQTLYGDLWLAEHIYSESEPGVPCNEELIGTHGVGADTDASGIYYLPAPKVFGPIGTSSMKVIAAPNDSLIECVDY